MKNLLRFALHVSLLAAVAVVLACPVAALAQNAPAAPIANIQSFEVNRLTNLFGLHGRNGYPELPIYLQTALEADKTLPVDSPAEGVLHTECANDSCHRIRFYLTDGPDGDTLWETYEWTGHLWYFWPRNPKNVATDVIEDLHQAYQGL